MARTEFALLCSSALEHGGLVSILGGGLNRVKAPQLPIQLVVTVVAQVYWADDELGRPAVLRILVEHADGEQLAKLDGHAIPARAPDAPAGFPAGMMLVQPLPLDIRR